MKNSYAGLDHRRCSAHHRQSCAAQVLLQRKSGVKLNSVTTMYYVSPCCAVFLLLPWGVLEAPKLVGAIQAR